MVGGRLVGSPNWDYFLGPSLTGMCDIKKSQQFWAMRHYREGLKAKCLWNMENGISVFRKDSLPPILNSSLPLCLRSMDRKWGPAECPKQIQTNDLKMKFFEVQYVDNIHFLSGSNLRQQVGVNFAPACWDCLAKTGGNQAWFLISNQKLAPVFVAFSWQGHPSG